MENPPPTTTFTVPRRWDIWDIHSILWFLLAFPVCLQVGGTRETVATRMGAHLVRWCRECPASEAAHEASSLKRVRLCLRTCSSSTWPRRSRVRSTRFSPCLPP